MRYLGFTLIELIVVIFTVAVLTALLLPALDATRQRADTVVCASNLRQLVMALSNYDQDNNTFTHGFDNITYGISEPPGGRAGDISNDFLGWWWFHFLDDLPGSDPAAANVLKCPSRNIVDVDLKGNILCGNYGVNRSVCKDTAGSSSDEFLGKPLSQANVRQPSQVLLIADSGYTLVSWQAATNDVAWHYENSLRDENFYIPGLTINKNRTFPDECQQDAIDDRHPGKTVNAGFVDGHVARIKADKLQVKEESGKFMNRSPLWVPK